MRRNCVLNHVRFQIEKDVNADNIFDIASRLFVMLLL